MDKYEVELGKKLKKLTKRNKLLFAFWVSKRLFNNYVYFNKRMSFGDIDAMLDAINLIEESLKTDTTNIDEVKRVITSIDNNAPDMDDFSTILASFALDSCNSLYESLEYILDEDDSHVINIGTYARDSVHMFVQELEGLDYEDPKFECKMHSNQFMIKEMSAQDSVLSKLAKSDVDISKDITFENIIDPSLVDDVSI
ncbi:DUF416 family protein [uncultured Croceitalea sp.]|uniref:DUF416 family protein n=1 Tax=uncultured Croceitalea sp. TaxID=1798908 RepID=UPI003305E1AC